MSRPRHPPSHLGSEFIMTARRFFIGFWMLLAVAGLGNVEPVQAATTGDDAAAIRDRKSVVEGKSVSGRVDIGGRGLMKKKHTITCLLQYRHEKIENIIMKDPTQL